MIGPTTPEQRKAAVKRILVEAPDTSHGAEHGVWAVAAGPSCVPSQRCAVSHLLAYATELWRTVGFAGQRGCDEIG